MIHPSDTTTYYNFRHDSADNGLHIDTTDGADRILFGIDGAATFAGKLQSKNSSDIAELASGTNTGFRLLENGTDANVVMGWDGSATFKDTVQVTDGTQYTKVYNSSDLFKLIALMGLIMSLKAGYQIQQLPLSRVTALPRLIHLFNLVNTQPVLLVPFKFLTTYCVSTSFQSW